MPAQAYYESLWEGVPAGLRPAHFQLRSSFLLHRVNQGDRVLDVGCGEGIFSSELKAAGAQVVGIDLAQEPLDRARRRDPELDLRLVDADGQLPFADSSFDVVWLGEVIEHVADTQGWLSEIRRVLRSGATLLLSTPAHGPLLLLAWALAPRRFDEHFDPRSDHLRFYTTRTLRALLEDFGFEQIEVLGAGGIPCARTLMLASARRSRF